tara:strand:- start:8676 stop:9452 length:777 start_codon:yes stop_codon:yes gene_type:complete
MISDSEYQFKKFDRFKGGSYSKKYVEKFREFHTQIGKALRNNLPKSRKLKGLDIGAGPGIGAKILDQLKFNVELYSIEPSKTYLDSVKLSKDLKKKKSSVKYMPKKGGISEIEEKFKLDEESLDFILFLRSLHEVKLSIGLRKLKTEIRSLSSLLKDGGLIIVADPQYSKEINKNPSKYRGLILEIRKLQEKTIGHSHHPREYISSEDIEKLMPPNIKKIKSLLFANKLFKKELEKKGIKTKSWAKGFHITIFKKRDK